MPFQIVALSHRQVSAAPPVSGGSPWDVSGAVLSSSFNVGIPIEVYDVAFSTDGTKMFYSGFSLNSPGTYEIYQFTLSTPWDETSHDNDYVGFSVLAQDDWVGGIAFNSDNGGSPAGPAAGTKFYITGVNTLAIYQYTLSTAWDLSTATIDTVGGSPGGAIITYSFGFGPPYEPSGITFDPSGTTMLVTDVNTGNNVYQYTLSTPWDVSSVSGSTSIDLSADYNTLQTSLLTTAVSFNDDGTYLYVLGSYWADIAQLKLTTPYDITSYVHFTRNRALPEYDEYVPQGMAIKPDGSKMYLVGTERNRAISYIMTTPWDLNTLQTNNSMSVLLSLGNDDNIDINFNDNGTKMYVLDLGDSHLYQYFLSTPWDVTTASYEFKRFFFNEILPYAYGFFIGDSGSKLYIMNNIGSSAKVHQWTLTTPWDVTTASNDFIIGSTNYGYSIKFSSDGTQMYTWDDYSGTENVRQQNLTTPWDVSTAAFVGLFDPIAQSNTLWGITFSTNGDKLYTVSTSDIYQYTLSPAWDITSAVYDNKTLNTALDGPNDAIAFNTDGTKMYKTGTTTNEANYFPTVNEYTLSTPWDISTAVLGITGKASVTGTTTLDFNDDGTSIFLGTTGNDLTQYNMAGSPIVPYDITTVGPYSSAAKYIGSQDSYPTGVAFSSDGLTMMIVGYNSDRVYQYSLTTPWSVSTATYTGLSFYTTSSSTPEGLEFSDDGLNMYVIKSSPDYVYQYKLTNPWDFTVAPTYYTIYATSDSVGTGVTFNPSGTLMFISGDSSNDVATTTLGTGWDLTTAGAPTAVKAVGSITLNDVAVSTDGTKFYIVNDSSDRVEQWTMSTPWDVTTATSDLVYYSTSTYPEGLWFRSDGLKMYILNGYFGADSVYEHNLAVAWDLSTAYSAADKASLGSTLTSVAFKPDGTVFYELTSSGTIRQYTPATAWTMSGSVDGGVVYTITDDIPAATSTIALQISSDGTKMYVLDAATNFIYQFSISPAWTFAGSPSPVSYNGISYNVASLDTTWWDMKISPDGTKILLLGDDNAKFHQLTLTTPWDLSTVSSERFTFPSKIYGKTSSRASFTFTGDGTTLYLGDSGGDIRNILLSTPWDISTAQYPHQYFNASVEGADPVSVVFSDDGFTMYFLADQAHKVYQFTLGTAWDSSTAITSAGSPAVGVYLTLLDDIETGMFFGASGTKMYIVGGLNSTIYQYTLSVAWDLTTATYDTVRFDTVEDRNPRDVIFNSTGTVMYVLGGLTTSIYQYTLGTGWDLSTVSAGSPVPSYDVGATTSIPETIDISGDGTKIFVFNFGAFSSRVLYQFDLATPWDITSASYSGSVFDADYESMYPLLTPYAMKFNFDGTKLFNVGAHFGYHVITYSTNTPWSLQSIQEDGSSTSLTLQSQTFENITFNADGTIMYMLSGGNVHQYALATPYDLTTTTYNDLFIDVGPQEHGMRDIDFNDDGTKMFLVGTTSDLVYQYSLSTAWEVTTAKYDFVSLPMSLAALTAQSITFSTDGTVAYVPDATTNTIYQYVLDVAWQVSSGSYVYTSYTVTEDTAIVGMDLNATGTKLYVVGDTTDAVYQYTLSTAWDISSATYDSVSLDISTESTTPIEIVFNVDGTKMYVVGSATNAVFQYTLGTGWNLATASYDSISLVIGNDSIVTGLSFKTDGLRMYIMGDSANTVYSYTLASGSPTGAWDISTAVSDTKSVSVEGQESSPQGVTFRPNGLEMYVVGSGTDSVYQYTLSVAWDASTAEYQGVSLLIQDSTPTGIEFNPNGLAMYVQGLSSHVIYKYTLSVAWDLSTAVAESKEGNLAQSTIPSTEEQWHGIHFKPDGTKLYAIGDRTDDVHEYDLTTPWDITTMVFVGNVGITGTTPTGVILDPTGMKMYIVSDGGDRIYQHALSVAWDITTATYLQFSAPNFTDTEPEGAYFKPDGLKMYLCGNSGNKIYQYSLSLAWDITTLTIDQTGSPGVDVELPIGTEDSFALGVFLKPDDGTKMYMVGDGNNTVYQYTLSSGWDLTTATYDTVSFSVATETTWPTDVAFNDDGSKMYVSAYNNSKVYEYDLGTLWDISTASFNPGRFYVGAEAFNAYDIRFGNNGFDMYVPDASSGFFYQYSMASAYDVVNATYGGISLDANPPDYAPQGMFFNPNGLQMFMCGSGTNKVHEYTLAGSPAWDLSTGVATGDTFTTLNSPTGVFFAPDGATMYLIYSTTGNKKVFQYGLSTPWDITTAVYTTSLFSVAGETTDPLGLEFASDGTKMYTLDPTPADNELFEYSMVTPWDITTAYKDDGVSSLDVNYSGLAFNSDGTKMYTSEMSTDDIIEWSLAIPWQVSTSSLSYTYNQLQDTFPYGLAFSDTGNKMYIMGSTANAVFQYTLGTPWELSTATYDTVSLSVAAEAGIYAAQYIEFDPNGTRLYVMVSEAQEVFSYTLSTPWDLLTAIYDSISSTAIATQEVWPAGMFFEADGLTMYMVGEDSQIVFQYSLSIAWNISTLSFVNSVNPPNPGSFKYKEISWKPDGTEMYITSYAGVYQYNVSPAWNFASASYGGTVMSLRGETLPTGIVMSTDGMRAFVLGSNTSKVYQFNLSSAFNLATAAFEATFYVGETTPNTFDFNVDGYQMFIVGTGNTVYQYSLSVAWDVTTITFDDVTFDASTEDSNVVGISFNTLDGSKMYLHGKSREIVYEYDLP